MLTLNPKRERIAESRTRLVSTEAHHANSATYLARNTMASVSAFSRERKVYDAIGNAHTLTEKDL